MGMILMGLVQPIILLLGSFDIIKLCFTDTLIANVLIHREGIQIKLVCNNVSLEMF